EARRGASWGLARLGALSLTGRGLLFASDRRCAKCPSQRLDISHQLPQGVGWQRIAPGRHALRPPFVDALVHFDRSAAVAPGGVGEIGAHPALGTVAMTAGAIHRSEKFLAFRHRTWVAAQRIGKA